MKSRELTFAIFEYYSKNFVKVNILLPKMHKLNFSRDFLHWTFSYLYNRKYFVQINTDVSTFLYPWFGVAQGSILGYILFHLCAANMSDTVNNCECLKYADDTTDSVYLVSVLS